MAQEQILTLGVRTKQALSDLNSFNSKLNQVGKSIALRVSAPLLALETIAIKTFSEMESGLTNITNLVDKGEGFESFSNEMDNVQESAIELGFAIDDVNKSLFDNVSALGQGEQALETYDEAQKLAKGGNAQLSETVDGLTSVINAYGRETTKASDVSNAFFTAQKQGKTTVAELASNIGKVAPVAKSAGIGFKELLATMAEMTLGGLSTDEATTSLRATISALIKPSEEAREILKKLEVPVGAVALKAKGLGFALKQLSKAQEENGDVLAKAIPNIRALTGVTSFNDEKLQHLKETQELINKDIKNGTGLNEAYTASMNDLGNIFQQTIGATKTLANAFGELFVEGFDLKTMLKDLGEGIKDLKDYVKNMTPEQKSMTLWVTGLATVVPSAAIAVTGLAASVGKMTIMLKAAVPVFKTLGGASGLIKAVGLAAGVSSTALIGLGGAVGVAAGAVALLTKAYLEMRDAQKGANSAEFNLKVQKAKLEILKLSKLGDDMVDALHGGLGSFLDDMLETSKKVNKLLPNEIGIAKAKEDSDLEFLDNFLDQMELETGITNALLPDGDEEIKPNQQEAFIESTKKGTVEAFKLENTVQNKVQASQLKELKAQTKELKNIASTTESEEVVYNFV